MSRIVCQFSCGAASAVAAKLAHAQHAATADVQVVNAYLVNEPEDNRRFLADVERWVGVPFTVLRDEKYGADVIQVFRRKRYMNGPIGAPCSRELKRKVLDAWLRPDDTLVFGYTAEEADRYEDFCERNPQLRVLAPLVDAGLGKEDCKAMVERAGIVLPISYRMGYDNANCIGCVKGGEAYWRAIREDYPVVFETYCVLQDELGPGSYFFRNRQTGERFSLRELGEGPVRRNDGLPSCSFFCEMAEQEYGA